MESAFSEKQFSARAFLMEKRNAEKAEASLAHDGAVRILPTEKAVTARRTRKQCSNTTRTLRAATISMRDTAAHGAGFVTVTWQGALSVRCAKSVRDTFAQHLCITSDLSPMAAHMMRAI